MKTLQTFILLILFTANIYAQPVEINDGNYDNSYNQTTKEYKEYSFTHGLGLSFSMLSCPSGMSYQYSFNDNHRLEFSGFAYYYEKNNIEIEKEKKVSFNFGLEYHYLLVEKYGTKLFYMIGTGYSYNENHEGFYDIFNDSKGIKRDFNSGTGVVIEIKRGSITWNIDIGARFKYRKESSFETEKQLTWGVGTGMYYNFN